MIAVENKTSFAILVIAFTLLLMTAFQTRQVLVEREAIGAAHGGQDAQLAQAEKVMAQFESVAVGTARLAGDGNATAQKLVAQLRQAGIVIHPDATKGQKQLEFKAPETAPAAAAPAAAPAPAPAGN